MFVLADVPHLFNNQAEVFRKRESPFLGITTSRGCNSKLLAVAVLEETVIIGRATVTTKDEFFDNLLRDKV